MDGAFSIHKGIQKFMQTFGQETKEQGGELLILWSSGGLL